MSESIKLRVQLNVSNEFFEAPAWMLLPNKKVITSEMLILLHALNDFNFIVQVNQDESGNDDDRATQILRLAVLS